MANKASQYDGIPPALQPFADEISAVAQNYMPNKGGTDEQRIAVFNVGLKALLGVGGFALGAQAIILPDGRIGAQPKLFNADAAEAEGKDQNAKPEAPAQPEQPASQAKGDGLTAAE